jgi:YesN/AraC family two-component response regulator
LKKEVLIIDDESSVLISFELLFDSYREFINIRTCSNINTALEYYRSMKFDAIIIDHNLQGKLGLEFIERSQANNVFYFSGKSIHPESIWPYKENIVDVFQKPRTDKIHKRVLSHLGVDFKPYLGKERTLNTSITDFASLSFKSPKSSQREFKSFYGVNSKDYKKEHKIKLAKKLLREQYPISIVSQRCGFSYRRNFQRFFKELTSETPAEYKKRYN